MYTQFFNFQEKPFNLTPKTSIFCESDAISPAYQSLLDGVRSGERLSLLTGNTGTGKTLCVQKLLEDLNKDPQYHAISLPFTSLPFDEMLGYFLADLNISFGLGHEQSKLEILNSFLQRGENNLVQSIVIIIDEAQNLTQLGFDGLLSLLALNENSVRKIQIVIVSRHESDLNLTHARMADFNRSISLRCHLESLRKQETLDYIRFQLNAVGYEHDDLFTKEAADKIYALTQGVPRPINILSDQALEIAASEQLQTVSVEHVETAFRQQKFEDTIEMNTFMISAALEQFEREQKPIQLINSRDQEFSTIGIRESEAIEFKVVEPKVAKPLEPEIVEAEVAKPAEQKLAIVEMSEIANSTPANDSPSPEYFEPQNPFNASSGATAQLGIEENKPSHILRTIFIGLLISLTAFGLAYYQLNQEQVLAYFEQQFSAKKKNKIKEPWTQYIHSKAEKTSSTKITEATPVQTNPATIIEPKSEPIIEENNTTYLTSHEEGYEQRQATIVPPSKAPLDENNGVVWIQSLINTIIDPEPIPLAESTPIVETKPAPIPATKPKQNVEIPITESYELHKDENVLISEIPVEQAVQKKIVTSEPAFSIEPVLNSRPIQRQKIVQEPIQESIAESSPESTQELAAETYSEIDHLLSTAEYQISINQITQPRNDSALNTYRSILKIDPENAQAREGIAKLKRNFISWARSNAHKEKYERAKRHYRKALIIDPDDVQIQNELAELEQYYPSETDQGISSNPSSQAELF